METHSSSMSFEFLADYLIVCQGWKTRVCFKLMYKAIGADPPIAMQVFSRSKLIEVVFRLTLIPSSLEMPDLTYVWAAKQIFVCFCFL